MASTVSGNLLAVGLSTEAVAAIDGEMAYVVSGTFAATIVLEKATTSSREQWVPVATGLGNGATGSIASRAGDAFRMRCTAYTSGTAGFVITAPAPVLPVKPASYRTPLKQTTFQLRLSQGQSTAGGATNKTFGCLHQLPAAAVGAQFEFANILTGSTATYNAAFALSSKINDWSTPCNAAGTPDDTLWTPITSGGSVSIVVPAAATAARTGRLLSDVMPFTSPPPARLDGGSGVLVFFRLCSTANGVTYHAQDATQGLWAGAINGQNPAQFSETYGGGFTATGANYAIAGAFAAGDQTGNRAAVMVPNSVTAALATGGLSIMSVGDSILSGVGSGVGVGVNMTAQDQGVDGMGFQLAKLLNLPGRPATHYNEAVSGETSANFLANGTNALAIMKPDVMLLQCFSANDGGPSAALSWTAFQGAMTLARTAAASGVRVLLFTMPPFSGVSSAFLTATWEASRLAANALVRASGLPYVDLDMVIGTGTTSPVSYRASLSNDLAHPNTAGAILAAVDMARVLSAYYGIS